MNESMETATDKPAVIGMKKNTKVTWLLKGETARRGNGVTITDEDDGHVLVAVDSFHGEALDYHPVIRCAVTWLKEVVESEDPEAGQPLPGQGQFLGHGTVIDHTELIASK